MSLATRVKDLIAALAARTPARFEPLVARVKGVLLNPSAEWAVIEAENRSVFDLYKNYIAILALIPPLATFLGAWLFGYSRGRLGMVHPTFGHGLYRAMAQYALTFPAIYIVAYMISSLAPFFDGESDDRKALALVAYSFTPAWLASFFGLIPGLRWLDVLGFYGVYVFYHGMSRMTKCPENNADVLTLVAMITAIAVGVLHSWIVHLIAPAQMM